MIIKVQDRLNGRPGKVLSWKRPYEALNELLRQKLVAEQGKLGCLMAYRLMAVISSARLFSLISQAKAV